MSTQQTLMILGLIVAIVLVVMFMTKNKSKDQSDPQVDVDEPEMEVDSDEADRGSVEVIRTIDPQSQPTRKVAPKARRKVRPVRSRPSRNHYHRTRHGYNEGLDIEDILFYMWLLEDSHVDYSEDFEWDVEGVEGVSMVSNVDGQVTFHDSEGKVVMEASNSNGQFEVTDSQLQKMSYTVDPETGEIKIHMNDEVQTVSYSDGEWSDDEPEAEAEVEVETEDSDLGVDEVVAAAVTSESIEQAADIMVESGTDDTSDSSSVDSDTAY